MCVYCFFADQDSVQLLNRSTQVGEFYIMSPPHTDPKEDARGFMGEHAFKS